MKLTIPPEPIELKAWMISLKHSHFEDSSGSRIDWDSFVVWSGNKLPKYLWDHWKVPLKSTGLTWQKFMRILRHRTDIGVLWYKGSLPWNEFAASVAKLVTEFHDKEAGSGVPSVAAQPHDAAQWQILPMQEWEKFERMCLDLWKEIWGDKNAQRVGCSGQRQNGVDIVGTLPGTGKTVGVQCKKKEAYVAETLTKDEIREIVDEAKSFKPQLSELVIAYTGKRDAALQEEARLITEEHRASGLFSVSISSWDDIVESLGSYGHVLSKHFPPFAGNNVDDKEVRRRIDAPRSKTGDPASVAPNLPAVAGEIAQAAAQAAVDSVSLSGEHDAEIDHARDLLEAHKHKESFDYLEKLEKRIWRTADAMRRFRILTNKAVALSGMSKPEDAGRLFIEAHQYNPDDEKALVNRALGHVLLEQMPQAEEYARKVLEKNPASVRAYGVLVNSAPREKTLEQIVQEIPPDLRKKEDIAFAIAHAARERGDIESGIHWLRVTIEDVHKSEKKLNPDLAASLGSAILESFMKRSEVLNEIQITPEDVSKIEEAISLLTDSINTIGADNLVYRTFWLANRSTAYKLLGQADKAVADMETVVRLQPTDAAMKKQYAFMLYANGNRERAIELLREVLGSPEVPEGALILAGILYENGKNDEAREILETASTEGFEQNLKDEMSRLLMHINMRESDTIRAQEISASLRASDPANILNLVDAARIEKRTGTAENASRLLDEARGYVNEKTPAHHIVELADELYDLEKFPDAWPLYERLADPRVKTNLVRNLLYSYYRSHETEKAIALARRIPPQHKDSFLMRVELSLFEDTGDLSRASEAAEEYLEAHPDDSEIRIRLATIWLRTDELEKLDSFLEQAPDFKTLPLAAGFQLAGLCAERGRHEKSLEIAYELRRQHFDDGEAHMKYIGAFFGNERQIKDMLEHPQEVVAGSAVRIKNDMAQDQWYLLEDRQDLNGAMSELSVSSDLGKKLLSAKAGDDVVTTEGSIESVVVKVVEVKNKYVHALHESMRLLPERFGSTKGLERFTFKSGSEEETKESVQKVLSVVEKRDEWVMQAEKFYRDTKLTIGAFAELIHQSPIRVWNGIVGSKAGVKTCLGTLQERQEAFDVLAKNKIVAIDITGLLSAERLKVLPVLEKRFEKILIAQSTVDLLLQEISDSKGMSSEGYTTISKQGDQFIREEVSAEMIQNRIEYLKGLKRWVRDHCEVTPLKQPVKADSDEERNRVEILGASFLDTMIIAKEQECPLYTDDFGTKALASNDFGIQSVWTQAVLMSALNDRQMTEDEYNDTVIELIRLRYRHTTVSGQIMIHAAKASGWANSGSFAEVLETFRGTEMEIRSAAGVMIEFMYRLWQEPILDFQRDNLIMAVLDVLADERDDRAVIRLMRAAVSVRFRMIPLTEARVQQVISAWEALRMKPGMIGF